MAPSHRLPSLFLSLVLLPQLILSAPLTQTTSSNPFCRSKSSVNHAYSIGPDFYLVQSSQSVYSFNSTTNELSPQKHTLAELFGKDNFQWVDTVISLTGFCQKSPLCLDETWKSLERLYIVIGNRRLSNRKKEYGFALYDYTDDAFRPLTLANVEQPLADKLAKIGLPLKQDETESVLMIGDFWPRFADNNYYQSGMFFPDRGELLLNYYEGSKPLSARKILRRTFSQTSGTGDEAWSTLDLSSLDSTGSNFDFSGMFRFNDKTYALDKNNVVYEFSWSGADKLQLSKVGSMHEFVNCYQNSSAVNEAAIAKADPNSNELKPETEATKPETTVSTTTTTSTVKPTEPEVEILKSSTSSNELSSNRVDTSDQNKSGEMLEVEDSPNDLETRQPGLRKPEADDDLEVSQSDDPRTHHPNVLAEASARGPVSSDDGLIWTFSILVGVLILLTIIILIPILIIRHNARSDRMYINKTTKKSTTNGNHPSSQNSEEVQLMNSSNIEK